MDKWYDERLAHQRMRKGRKLGRSLLNEYHRFIPFYVPFLVEYQISIPKYQEQNLRRRMRTEIDLLNALGRGIRGHCLPDTYPF